MQAITARGDLAEQRLQLNTALGQARDTVGQVVSRRGAPRLIRLTNVSGFANSDENASAIRVSSDVCAVSDCGSVRPGRQVFALSHANDRGTLLARITVIA